MLVLDSENAKADAALFAQAGIGSFEPFFFERAARSPHGSEVPVAFTLAFARDEAAPHAGFFVCQQHHPENFWNPAFQRHPNGAESLSVVAYAVPDPETHRGFLTTFTGEAPSRAAERDLSFALARGRLDVLTQDDAAEVYGSVEAEPDMPGFVAYAVRLPEIRRQARLLEAAAIPFQRMGSRLVVPASAAFGVAVAFEPA